jgi:hypothetical protein
MKKIALYCVVLMLFAGSQVFSQIPDIQFDDLKKSVDKFSDNLSRSLPFNSGLGLNWSDAFIKKIPHFGLGFAVGFTTMEADSLDKVLSYFDVGLPMKLKGFPLPGYTVEGRLGGFGIPFDIGVKFGYLPIKPSGFKMNYLLAGGDVRFAILEKNVILPTISVGVGFNYLSGGIEKSIGSGMHFDYQDGNYLDVSQPILYFNWSTASLDFKAQISKSFIIVTPYFGVGASHGWSKAGYGVDATVRDSSGSLEAAKEILKQYDIYNLSENGFSSLKELRGWSARMFGGLSFNITFFRIDLTGLFNIIDKNYGASLGFRVQL